MNQCSKAISKKAGGELKESCEKWIKENGQLIEGNIAVTHGAKLRCKNVIHVVCPYWDVNEGEKASF